MLFTRSSFGIWETEDEDIAADRNHPLHHLTRGHAGPHYRSWSGLVRRQRLLEVQELRAWLRPQDERREGPRGPHQAPPGARPLQSRHEAHPGDVEAERAVPHPLRQAP